MVIVVLSIILCTTAEAKGGGKGGGSHGGSHASRPFSGTGSNSNSHGVRGYTKKDGHYVAPHRSTNPNSTQRDNYSAKGNYNPSNGRTGNSYVNH